MNAQPSNLEMGQPAPPATKSRGGCLFLSLLILLLMVISLLAGGVGGWFTRGIFDAEPPPPPPEGWRQIAPGLGVGPAEESGYLLFTIDAEIAEPWGSGETVRAKVIDVPHNEDEARAASDDLQQAILDRDDRGAVYRILCLLAAEQPVQRAADFYILEAVTQGREGLVVGMIRAGLRPDAVDTQNNNALHLAARHNRDQIVSALLAGEAFAADRRNGLGQTPLAVAAASGGTQSVEALLDHAKTNGTLPELLSDQDNAGRTPLQLAESAGHTQCVEVIRSYSR